MWHNNYGLLFICFYVLSWSKSVSTSLLCDQQKICKCSIGYTGENCEMKCQNNTYGENCSKNCTNCFMGECNHITGECDCWIGYSEFDCSRISPKIISLVVCLHLIPVLIGILTVVLVLRRLRYISRYDVYEKRFSRRPMSELESISEDLLYTNS